MIPNTPKCFRNHMGLWLVEPKVAQRHLHDIKTGLVEADEPTPMETDTIEGIRYIPVTGTLMRSRSKFGGTSTVDLRREIVRANKDDDVRGIALYVDSPGGTADGTDEAFDTIRASAKPVRTFAPYAASAAYWLSAGSQSITVPKMGMVGSIGSYIVLYDSTGAMENEGVQAYLVSSGGVKGHGADGKVTPELLAEAQKTVDFVDSFFAAGVREGRGMDEETESALHTGQMFTPDEALANGLVDNVASFDEFLTTFIEDVRPKSRNRRTAAESRLANYRS